MGVGPASRPRVLTLVQLVRNQNPWFNRPAPVVPPFRGGAIASNRAIVESWLYSDPFTASDEHHIVCSSGGEPRYRIGTNDPSQMEVFDPSLPLSTIPQI